MSNVIPVKQIVSRILDIRGQKVMLDRNLAILYGVETRAPNHVAARNNDRFPDDFMFQLSKDELDKRKSQIVISNSDKRASGDHRMLSPNTESSCSLTFWEAIEQYKSASRSLGFL